jgi:hypothetical protein
MLSQKLLKLKDRQEKIDLLYNLGIRMTQVNGRWHICGSVARKPYEWNNEAADIMLSDTYRSRDEAWDTLIRFTEGK